MEVADRRPSEFDQRHGYVDVDVTGRVANGDGSSDGDPVVTWRVLGMVRRGDSAST